MLLILLLLSLTTHAQKVGDDSNFRVTYTQLKGFGVDYHVALQVFGPNPGVSVFDLLQEENEPAPTITYDLRMWIWESNEWQWWFKNIDTSVATQFKWTVCTDPYVEALWYQLGGPGKNMWLLYPYSNLGTGLDMRMLKLADDLNTDISLAGCNDIGWERDNDERAIPNTHHTSNGNEDPEATG